jgi:replicative DNA helicase
VAVPNRKGKDDLRTPIQRAKSELDDLGNALDAGMFDSANATIGRIHAQLTEAEHDQGKQNGRVPLAAVPTNGKTVPLPQAAEAEEAVLGAMMLAPAAIKAAAQEVRPEHFFGESHRLIFEAILALDEQGMGVDSITVIGQLDQTGQLGNISGANGGEGGKARIHEIAGLALTSANVGQYAQQVRKVAYERRLAIAITNPRDTDEITEAAAAITRERVVGGPRRALDGGEWLATQPEGCPSVWGTTDRVLWAQGEPLMIYGPDGVGKTSVAQQIVLHLCGIRMDSLFDLPFARADRPVLYLACDRPRQARRSLYRMVPREKHELLNGKLLVWEGPLPFSLSGNPRALLEFAQLHEAGYVIVDSLKDVAVQLTDPETALKVNHSFQWLMANGVELLVLHHPRKDPAGMPARAKTLEDVYGDRNFVAGMGSVISLYGKAGDPIVSLEHLKQPAGEVGPFKILHQHDTGSSFLYEHRSMADILVDSGRPLTIAEIAGMFYASAEPSKAEQQKVRNTLKKMLADGDVVEMKDLESGATAFAAR